MSPIKSLHPKRPSYVHKALGLKIKSNAFIELHNLIFSNKYNLLKISTKDVSHIEDQYNISFKKYFNKERKKILRCFLEHYIKNKQLDEDKINDLKHLSKLLRLKKSECKKEVNHVCAEIYHAKVEKLLKGGKIDYEEQEKVNTLFLSDLEK